MVFVTPSLAEGPPPRSGPAAAGGGGEKKRYFPNFAAAVPAQGERKTETRLQLSSGCAGAGGANTREVIRYRNQNASRRGWASQKPVCFHNRKASWRGRATQKPCVVTVKTPLGEVMRRKNHMFSQSKRPSARLGVTKTMRFHCQNASRRGWALQKPYVFIVNMPLGEAGRHKNHEFSKPKRLSASAGVTKTMCCHT